MTDAELTRLEKLCADATPGPWRSGRADMVSYGINDGPYKNIYCDDPRGGVHHVTGLSLPYTVARGEGDENECLANAAFIAAARAAMPELITEVVRQRDAGRELWDSRAEVIREHDKLRAENEQLRKEALIDEDESLALSRQVESLTRDLAGARALHEAAEREVSAWRVDLDDYRSICARIGRDTGTDRAYCDIDAAVCLLDDHGVPAADFDDRIRKLIDMYETAEMSRVELSKECGELEAKNEALKKAVVDANRGAERNMHLARELTNQNLLLKAEMARLMLATGGKNG